MWCLSSCRKEKPQDLLEVSERFKYALSGVYTIENFSSIPIGFEFQSIDIGSLCGKQWRIYLNRSTDDTVYAAIGNRGLPSDDLKVSAYFNIVNKNRKIKLEDKIHFEKFDWAVFSQNIKVEDVLEQSKGWLVDDKLSIEYGIHVHSIKENDDRWKFNFEGKPFNCEDKNMIILRHSESVDSEFFGFNRKFLSFHTNYFDGSPDEEFFIRDGIDSKLVNECFQIAHGIRIKFLCLKTRQLLRTCGAVLQCSKSLF